MKFLTMLLMAAFSIFSLVGFAQDSVQQSKPSGQKAVKMIYRCSMHPEVTSNNPGKCPKCGMELKKTATTAQTYSCPVHPEITSDKPGACSKCGRELMPGQSLKEKMKMDVMKIYACPMHPDVTSNKPGKCPKCGMEMKEKKKEDKK